MGITREELIAKLNKDLEWEYAAAVQYVQHSAVLTGPKYTDVQKELVVHAKEELVHAISISEQIDYLGGVPSINVEATETSSKAVELLKQDLKGERHAIESYKERIFEAESLREYGLRRILEDVLIQEEEHERDISAALEDQ